jgi:hypothetical protein
MLEEGAEVSGGEVCATPHFDEHVVENGSEEDPE